jgi:hypothetical protein
MNDRIITILDKLVECEEILKKLSISYEIDLINLRRLYDDMARKLKYSRPTILDLITDDLANGLDINKIILKYNLDKDLI